MGFVRLQCSVCDGKGYTVPSRRGAYICPMSCTNCNGEGTITTHTGVIGSSIISVDPSARNKAQWAVMWRKLDDGTICIDDMALVDPVKL